MTVYKLYDPNTDWRTLLWLRHLPVYIGEVFFYFFITTFSKRFIEIEDAPTKPQPVVLKQNILVLTPLFFFATGITWEQYVTDAGLPHIFTLPIFVVMISLVRLRLNVYASKYTHVVNLFTLAIGGWVLIHVSEFLGESQKLFNPTLANIMPHIEFAWYCVGAIIFWYALKSFKNIQHAEKV